MYNASQTLDAEVHACEMRGLQEPLYPLALPIKLLETSHPNVIAKEPPRVKFGVPGNSILSRVLARLTHIHCSTTAPHATVSYMPQ